MYLFIYLFIHSLIILLFITINVDVKTDKKGAGKPKKTIDMYEITKKQSQGRALKWLFWLLQRQGLVERKI